MPIPYFDHSHLPPALQKALDAQLDPDEILVWTDQPRAAQLLERGMKGFLMPFILGVFASIPLIHGFRHLDTDLFFFLLTMFGAIAAPIALFRRVTRMVYVLTNKRALIITGTARRAVEVQSFFPQDLQSLDVKQNADGTGDIVFSSATGKLWNPATMSAAKRRVKKKKLISPGFYGVREVKRVESL